MTIKDKKLVRILFWMGEGRGEKERTECIEIKYVNIASFTKLFWIIFYCFPFWILSTLSICEIINEWPLSSNSTDENMFVIEHSQQLFKFFKILTNKFYWMFSLIFLYKLIKNKFRVQYSLALSRAFLIFSFFTFLKTFKKTIFMEIFFLNVAIFNNI